MCAVDPRADPVADRHPWRAAIVLGLATIALGMAYTILIMPAITHTRGWWVVGEVWPPLLGARFVANGALGYLYSADPFFVAGPIGAMALVPVVIVGDTLHLTDNYRYLVPHPTMWLVYGPYALGFGMALLYAARALAHQVWVEEGLAARGIAPRYLWTQATMVGLVLMPAAVVYGHFEDVLALALVLLGIRSMFSGRFGAAAMWFGLAIGTKQWALLGLPILVAATPATTRLRTLARSLVIPAALMAFTLSVDWSHASVGLFRPRAFPQLGHAALWVSRSGGEIVGPPERWGAILTAIGLAYWLRDRREPRLLLAGFALAFLSRVLFEPVVFAYYLVPALALMFLHERGAGRTGLRTTVGGGAIMLFFLLHPNPWLWWAVTAAGIGWVASPAARDVLGRGELPVEPGGERSMAVEPVADLTHVST